MMFGGTFAQLSYSPRLRFQDIAQLFNISLVLAPTYAGKQGANQIRSLLYAS